MKTKADSSNQSSQSKANANHVARKPTLQTASFKPPEAEPLAFVDNRPDTIAQRKWHALAKNSSHVQQLKALQEMANNNLQVRQAAPFQVRANNHAAKTAHRKEHNAGSHQHMKAGYASSSPPIQLAAITLFPKGYYKIFTPKYKVWRDSYWSSRKVVYGTHTISRIMELINNADATHVGADGTHKNQNESYAGELQQLNTLMATAKGHNDEDRESLQALDAFQTFVVDLDRFLDKWEDRYGETEKSEKDRLAEILVKVTTQGDLKIKYFDSYSYSSELEEYKEILKAKILRDSRRIATLRGKDSFKLHLRDDDPDEVAAAIDRAVDKLRNEGNLTTRIKPTGDTEWSSWRTTDCVFAAIIYVMNNDTAKYTSTLGQNPKFLKDENAERDEAGTIADTLGIGHGVVEDPVLFNIMGRLGWKYIANETWNSWVDGNKYSGGTTYVISYSRSQTGDANHTVVFKDGDVYDRQGQRLGGAVDLEPTYKAQPMEIWVVDTVAAGKILS